MRRRLITYIINTEAPKGTGADSPAVQSGDSAEYSRGQKARAGENLPNLEAKVTGLQKQSSPSQPQREKESADTQPEKASEDKEIRKTATERLCVAGFATAINTSWPDVRRKGTAREAAVEAVAASQDGPHLLRPS